MNRRQIFAAARKGWFDPSETYHLLCDLDFAPLPPSEIERVFLRAAEDAYFREFENFFRTMEFSGTNPESPRLTISTVANSANSQGSIK